MFSSSGSAGAGCIQGTEAAIADPHSLLSPNWAGHLTTLEPGGQKTHATLITQNPLSFEPFTCCHKALYS